MMVTPIACVVDASVGIKLFITEALSAEAHALFAHLAKDPAARFVVPELFYLECANILWKHTQRFGLAVVDAERNLSALSALAVQPLPVLPLVAKALVIAAHFGISAYDACYVAVAHHVDLPLVTADSKLATRMVGSPYRVFDLGQLSVPPAR